MFRCLPPLKKHSGAVRCICYSSLGSVFASACSGGLIIVWDSLTFVPQYTIAGERDGVRDLSFSPVDVYLVSAESSMAKVYSILHDYALVKELRDFSAADIVSNVVFSSCGRFCAVSSSLNSTVFVYDVKMSFYVSAKLFCSPGFVTAMRYSVDCCWFAMGTHEGSLVLADASKARLKVTDVCNHHTSEVTSIIFSHPTDYVIVCSADASVSIHAVLEKLALRRVVCLSAFAVCCGVAMPCGDHIALGSTDGTVSVLDVDNGFAARCSAKDFSGSALSVAVSKNDINLLTGTRDGVIFVRECVWIVAKRLRMVLELTQQRRCEWDALSPAATCCKLLTSTSLMSFVSSFL